MYLKLEHPPVSVDGYLSQWDPKLAAELTSLANSLRHLKFIHLNSTATGGGVAEILQSMVPLMSALGLNTERIVMEGSPEFFQVTKRIHNLLQGADGSLSTHEFDTYLRTNQEVADAFMNGGLAADVWFFHDPQVLPLASMLPGAKGAIRNWICHIDLTSPNRSTIDSLLPYTQDYNSLFFSLKTYVPQGLGEVAVHIAPPAIDPLTEKNSPLSEADALSTVAAMGIDPARPLISQVSRFDLWKDPIGVVEAYRMARQHIPGLQLALLGLSQATDDPEAIDVLQQVTENAAGDPDIHLYFYTDGLSYSIDHLVNAFQVASKVVMQKSTREGFGLTVTEAMWKGKPVIGGNVGGIRVQIENGVNGFLVDSPQECADRIVQLMQDPALRSRLGEAARQSVRERFLLPRLTLDYLRVVQQRLYGHKVNDVAHRVFANGANGTDELTPHSSAAQVSGQPEKGQG
jgi:trehalose synthase